MARTDRPRPALGRRLRIVLQGAGAVGARAARQLASTDGLEQLVVTDAVPARAEAVADALGEPARAEAWGPDALERATVALLASPGDQRQAAEDALDHGAAVVSASDDLFVVRRLLDLDPEARERGRPVVVGAGFSPGLTCILARHAAAAFDTVDEVHVAKVGAGGPACARQHHDALGAEAVDWRDRAWVRRRAGTGRELCWFPDPVGAVDCYRAALPDPVLLVPAFPGVERVTARIGANRRDRLTARLPMMRRPHPEGRAGAVRVEVRGWRGRTRDVRVLGAMDRPAAAAGTVAAVAAWYAATDRVLRAGAGGLAELVEPVPFLGELARRGVRAAVFEGSGRRVS